MENFQEKIRVFFSERDRKTLLYEVGVGFGVVVVCKVTHFLLKNTLLHPIQLLSFLFRGTTISKRSKKGWMRENCRKYSDQKYFLDRLLGRSSNARIEIKRMQYLEPEKRHINSDRF